MFYTICFRVINYFYSPFSFYDKLLRDVIDCGEDDESCNVASAQSLHIKSASF